MYGTVARMRLKPGSGDRLAELQREYEDLKIPGFVASYVYRTDADPDEVYLVVVFEDGETYRANAEDPAQDKRFRELAELLDGEPEWHDGEIIWASTAAG